MTDERVQNSVPKKMKAGEASGSDESSQLCVCVCLAWPQWTGSGGETLSKQLLQNNSLWFLHRRGHRGHPEDHFWFNEDWLVQNPNTTPTHPPPYPPSTHTSLFHHALLLIASSKACYVRVWSHLAVSPRLHLFIFGNSFLNTELQQVI